MEVKRNSFAGLACFFMLFLAATDGHSGPINCANPDNVLVQGNSATFYQTIAEAKNGISCSDGEVIKLRAGTFAEDLSLDFACNKLIEIVGGYDCDFIDNSELMTGITGSLIIGGSFSGAASFSNIGVMAQPCESAVDNDGDGYSAIGSCGSADDCNDNNASINPGAIDIPGDGIDQDCSGQDQVFPEFAECTPCHNLNALGVEIYAAHSNFPTPDTTCSGCHAAAVSNILSGHYGKKVRTDGNGMTAGSSINCWSCHDWHNPNEYDFGPVPDIVWSKIRLAGVSRNCDTCHETRAAAHATNTAHNKRVTDGYCANCHTSDTSNLGSPGSGTLTNNADIDALHRSDCYLCHNYSGLKVSAAIVKQVIRNGMKGSMISCLNCHTNKAANHGGSSGKHPEHLALAGVSCDTCHSTPPLFKDGQDLNGTNVCYTCHQDANGNPIVGIKDGWNIPGIGLGCDGCHAVAPSTGSHNTHLALTDCSSCHDSAIVNTTAPAQHLDGNIDVYDATPGDLGYPVDKGIATPYGSCSTAYCHGIGTPTWGGTVACGDCHAVNGVELIPHTHVGHYGSSINAADFSAGNISEPDNYIFGCGTCHNQSGSGYTGHGSGPASLPQVADVYFDTVTAGGAPGGAGYSKGTVPSVDSPDPNGFAFSAGTCSSIYCHSDGTKNAGPYVEKDNPTWGSSLSSGCIGCHDSDNLSADIMATGSHGQHIIDDDASPSPRNKLDCYRCHAATVEGVFAGRTSDNRTIIDKTKHVNRQVNIAFDATADPAGAGSYAGAPAGPMAKTPGSGFGACANTYCHSQGTSVTAPYPAPNYIGALTWGMDATNFGHPDNPTNKCSACHGGYEDVTYGGITTNAHQAHVGNAAIDTIGDTIGCSNCHRATTSGGMQLNTPENHTDGFVEIKFEKDLMEYRGINFDTDGGTGPTYAGQNTAGDDTLTNFAQVVPDPSTKFSCSNVYCHSNGNLAANVNNVYSSDPVTEHWGEGALADPATAFKTIEWNSTTHISCDGCHGDGAGRAHPTYANGGAGTTTANSHVTHVEGAGLNCTYCHFETLSDTNIPPTGGIFSEHHVDRLEDVSIKPLAGTTPDAYEAEGPKTCTAVYCHSNGVAVATGTLNPLPLLVQWGSAGMTCNSCHNTSAGSNNGPDYANGSPKANSHAAHQGFGCQTCHYNTTSDGVTITNVAAHVNGVYDIEAGSGVAFNYTFDPTGSTCSNLSCHGDAVWGQSVAHTVEVGPNDLSYTAPGQPCSDCHVVADWSQIEGVEHNVDTNGPGSCATCHNSTRQEVIDAIAAGTDPTYCLDCHSDKELTPHGSVDHVAYGYVTVTPSPCGTCHDPGGAANATVEVTHHGNCSLCHTTVPNLQSGVPSGGGECTTCHGTDVGAIHPSCTTCHGEPPAVGAHDAHAALGFGSVSPICGACHDGASHADGTVDLGIPSNFDAKSGPAVVNSNGTCSSTRCHGGQTTPNFMTGSINVNTQCTSCHQRSTAQYNGNTSGKHDKHRNYSCTECHNTGVLATGHFSNLETTTFELSPGTTIGGTGTSIPANGWDDSRNRCSNFSCHGKNHYGYSW